MPIAYGHKVTPQRLSAEDRRHGYIALNLIGNWDDWVKRRVESLEFVSDSAVRRRVSVDFRIRSWLPEPTLNWDGVGVYYFPLALLKKQSLTDFDLHDEKGRSVSLLTRRKNAAVAAATLAAMAQVTVWTALAEELGVAAMRRGRRPGQRRRPQRPQRIALPRAIEDDLLRIAYLPFEDGPGGESALAVMDAFLGPAPAQTRPLIDWRWRRGGAGRSMVSSASEAEWRWLLARSPRMRSLMADLAQLWMVSVPIKAQSRRRRVIKFSYMETVDEQRMVLLDRRRKVSKQLGVFDFLADLEDRIEHLPTDAAGKREWDGHRIDSGGPLKVGLGQKLLEGLGWRGREFSFQAPAVGMGGSYHLEMQAPEGLQIRRASLTAVHRGSSERTYAVRGARSLQRAHLYVGDVSAGANGDASLTMKPRTTTMIRPLWMLAAASLLVLGLARWQFAALSSDHYGRSEDLVALFLLLPTLLAAAIARPSEDEMTTQLVFGLRMLAVLVALWPLAAGALLAVARGWPPLAHIWWGLIGGAAVPFVLLSFSWRLSGRRRPDGSAP